MFRRRLHLAYSQILHGPLHRATLSISELQKQMPLSVEVAVELRVEVYPSAMMTRVKSPCHLRSPPEESLSLRGLHLGQRVQIV